MKVIQGDPAVLQRYLPVDGEIERLEGDCFMPRTVTDHPITGLGVVERKTENGTTRTPFAWNSAIIRVPVYGIIVRCHESDTRT